MIQEQLSRGAQAVSIGGESLPMTMQAQWEHLTLEDAVASGEFDIPEQPGWVRIPVTLHVMIPGAMLEGHVDGEGG